MAEESDAWARGAWIWDAAVYGLLGLATLAALLDGVAPGVRLALPAIAAVFGVCYWWSARRYIGEEQRPPASVLPLLGLLVALWCLLTWLHPAYFLLLFGLYPALYRSLPLRWAIGAALGLTVLVVAIQLARSGGSFADNWYVLVNGAITAVLGVLFAVWVSGIIDQSHERKRLIEQLEATRSELAAAEREAGRLGERQRLAREIHDTLTQGYVSIVLLLQAAEGELPPGADEARRRLALAARTARENLAEARRLVWELRPAALRAASLGEAVGRLAERLAEETGVAATATVTGTPRPLAPEAEVTIVRAAQEALANVRRHAGASRVTLTLSYMEGATVLDVRDDGVGFAPARLDGDHALPDGGFGLRAMRERVAALGGSLAVESAAGSGTTVAVTLPAERCP